MSYKSQYPCQYSIFRTTYLTYVRHNIYSVILPKLRQEFKRSLSKIMAASQSDERVRVQSPTVFPSTSAVLAPTAYCGLHEIVHGRRGGIDIQ